MIRTAVLGRDVSTVGGATITLSTVPAGEAWIAKEVAVFVGSGAAAAVVVYFAPAVGAVDGFLVVDSIASGALKRFPVYMVADAGCGLKFSSDQVSTHCWVSGVKLAAI